MPVRSPPDVDEPELPDDCFEDEPGELPEPVDAELDDLLEECCAVAA